MSKKLSEMSLEELWQLFPIFLENHKTYWVDWYNEEVKNLKNILPQAIDFYHIGSTAISGIMAKPIIDIIVAVDTCNQMSQVANILKENGYIIMSEKDNRMSLNKGYTESGFAEKVYHIHLRLKGDIDEVYFKNYLIANPDIAKEYEELKIRLWKKYEFDRDAYTNAKTEFVQKYTKLAKLKYMLIQIGVYYD